MDPAHKVVPFEKRLDKYEAVLVARTETYDNGEFVKVSGAQDEKKRLFLKGIVVVFAGFFISSLFPKRAEALVLGSTPSTGVVGLRDSNNNRVDPAILEGNTITRFTTVLAASGTVHAPSSGKRITLYACKFSLDTSMTSVSFRFTSSGTDFEKYFAPVTGGLYGTNSHPNYVLGGVNQDLYCNIVGNRQRAS